MEWFRAWNDGILRGSLARTSEVIQLIWIKLIAIENETRARDGWLHFAPGQPMTREYLAQVCGVSVDWLEEALRMFLGDMDNHGRARIKINPDDGDIFLMNWEHYQAVPGRRNQEDRSVEDTLGVEEGLRSLCTLYEKEIGVISPIISQQLIDFAASYKESGAPLDWIPEAFTEAANHNKRNWAYVKAILNRWISEGKGKRKEESTQEEAVKEWDERQKQFIEENSAAD